MEPRAGSDTGLRNVCALAVMRSPQLFDGRAGRELPTTGVHSDHRRYSCGFGRGLGRSDAGGRRSALYCWRVSRFYLVSVSFSSSSDGSSTMAPPLPSTGSSQTARQLSGEPIASPSLTESLSMAVSSREDASPSHPMSQSDVKTNTRSASIGRARCLNRADYYNVNSAEEKESSQAQQAIARSCATSALRSTGRD